MTDVSRRALIASCGTALLAGCPGDGDGTGTPTEPPRPRPRWSVDPVGQTAEEASLYLHSPEPGTVSGALEVVTAGDPRTAGIEAPSGQATEGSIADDGAVVFGDEEDPLVMEDGDWQMTIVGQDGSVIGRPVVRIVETDECVRNAADRTPEADRGTVECE